MQETQLILIIIPYLISFGQCKMNPFIVNGTVANIVDFAYSAYLDTMCVNINKQTTNYVCGSSIINQQLLLTAAHCMDECIAGTIISASIGHARKGAGGISTANSFIIHEHFNKRSLLNDVGIVKLNTPIKFNSEIQRLALMKDPPYYEQALIAGWGEIDVKMQKSIEQLHYTSQYVKSKEECQMYAKKDIEGTFCASGKLGYAARGDSGSPLVVRRYIQIGIVSHKATNTDNLKMTIYTDIGYFYNWIERNSVKIMCSE